MTKSIKQLRTGADKRAEMKNKDGSPIHYDQQDQIPVITKVSEETVPHTDLKVWRKHAKEAGGYVEDHGNHYEAWDINHRKIGHFDMTAGHGHIHDNRPMMLKRQAESFEMNEATSPEYLNWKEGVITKHGKVTFKTKPQHTPEGWNYVTTAHKDDKPVDSYLHSHRAAVLAGKHGEEARQRALAREAVETLDELYPIFEEAGLFEYLSPSRKEEARSKAEYESHLAQSAAHAHVTKSAHKHARKAQRYLKLAIESRYGAGLPVNIADHNPRTCRACRHLMKSGRFKTYGELHRHAMDYPHVHGSYATDTVGKKLKEDTLIEAGSSKSNMKRKYLGKSKGRTKVGTKAHPIDVKPKITFKDPGAIGRAGTMKMPQPTAMKGL